VVERPDIIVGAWRKAEQLGLVASQFRCCVKNNAGNLDVKFFELMWHGVSSGANYLLDDLRSFGAYWANTSLGSVALSSSG
jgi:hypothetical protein